MHIHSDKNPKNLKKKAATELTLHLKEFHDLPILLLLSGGSSLDLLNYVSENDVSKNCTISFLDERYTKLIEDTNYYMFMQTDFYRKLKGKGCEMLDLRVAKDETLKALSERFEVFLRSWKEKHINGKIIITQGIGEDGHTAGIMPFSENKILFEALFNNNNWVVGYDAGKKNKFPQRITVTNTFLKEVVDVSIVFTQGSKKKEALQAVLKNKKPTHEIPASVLYDMKEVHIFTDYKL